MGDWLAERAGSHGASTLVEAAGECLTYGNVEDLVAARAKALGDRSGFQMVIHPRIDIPSLVELAAARRAGATVVVVGPDRPDAEELAARAGRDLRPAHTVLFTSGSAGKPKGVRLGAGNWEAAALASQSHLHHQPGERWLCPLPLHHVGGLGVFFRAIITGGVIVLAASLEQLLAELPRVQWASIVPTQLHRLLRTGTRFASSPRMLLGGGPCPPALLEQGYRAGLKLFPTYGMTETTGQVATSPEPGGSLRPLPGIELAIGSGGNICIEGPTVMLGYLGEDEAEGRFEAPDRGRLAPDGSLIVEGRADRVIITGGEKVDPDWVASVLADHPGVEEVAVFGLPDPEWGELVVAAYSGPVESDELAEAAASLPRSARPKRWLRLEALPRTELGKVDLSILAQLAG